MSAQWQGWQTLPGGTSWNPALTVSPDGRAHALVIGTDHFVYYNAQTSNQGPWTGWQRGPFGGIQAWYADPCMAIGPDGRVQALIQSEDNSGIYWTAQWSADGAWPQGSQGLGGAGGFLQLAIGPDNRFAAIAHGTDDIAYYLALTPHGLTGWQSLGFKIIGQPQVSVGPDGRAHAMVHTRSNDVCYNAQTSPGEGWASSWLCFTPPGEAVRIGPRLAIGGDNVAHALIIAEQSYSGPGIPMYNSQQSPGSSDWWQWESLGGESMSRFPALAIGPDGRARAVIVGTDGQYYYNAQTSSGGSWTGWEALGFYGSDPALAVGADGRTHVLGMASGGGPQDCSYNATL